jgi:hypothetical protein
MQQVFRTKRVFGTLALCATLGTGALLAQDKAAPPAAGGGGGGVTFQNDSNHAIQVFARYGSDDACVRRPNQIELSVAPGSSSTVESGSTKVCFCLDVPSRNDCPSGWTEVKPGGKRVLR